MPFPELPEGQTHSMNDGCGEPAHNVTAKKLAIGVSYMHKNKWGYRTIIDITQDRKNVAYKEDRGRIGYCSAAHFAETMPTVATPEQIKEIQENIAKMEEPSAPIFLPGVKEAIDQVNRYNL